MTNAANAQGRRRRRWLLGLGVALGLLLATLFLASRWVLPGLVEGSLSDALGVPVSIERINLELPSLDVTADGARFGQPEGFGEEAMFEASRIELRGWWGCFSSVLRIDELRIEDLKLRLLTKRDGAFNVNAFIDGFRSERKGERGKDVLIERIAVAPLVASHRDESIDGQVFRLAFVEGRMDIERLAVGSFDELDAGEVELRGMLAQAGGVGAPVYVFGRFGPLGAGEVELAAALRLTGCEYRTFVPIIPENTGLILGGKGFDLNADLKVARGLMDFQGGGIASNEGHYAFRVYGPLEAPTFALPKKLESVTSRMTGGMGEVLRSALASSDDVVRGAVGTAETFGKGALSAVGSFFGGIGKTAAGVARGDKEAVESGMEKATTETAERLVGTVTGSVETIAHSGEQTLAAFADDPEFARWMAAIPERHESRVAGLKRTLSAATFPPKIAHLQSGAPIPE